RRFCLIPCLHDEPYARLAFTRTLLSEAKALFFNTLPEYELAHTIASDLGLAARRRPRPGCAAGTGLGSIPPSLWRVRSVRGLHGPIGGGPRTSLCSSAVSYATRSVGEGT